MAIPFHVYSITGSSLSVGLVGLCELVPLLTLSLVGGAIADTLDRRRLLMSADLAGAACSVVLAFNALWDLLWLLYVMAFSHAALYALSSPALRSATPLLIAKDKLASAAALDYVRFNTGQIAGPSVAGVLIASVGLPLVFALDAATFIASALIVRRAQPMPAAKDAERVSLSAVLDGIRFLKGKPVLRGSFLVDINAMVFGFPNELFPAIAARLRDRACWACSMPRPPPEHSERRS